MTDTLLVVVLVGVGLLLALGWTLIHLLRQSGRVLTRLDALEAAAAANGSGPTSLPTPALSEPGLPIGSVAPGFSLPGLYGETLTLDALRANEKPVLLVFADPSSGPCHALLPDVGRWQREEALTVAIVSEGSAEANRAMAAKQTLTRVLLQRDREVAAAYGANSTPAAVIVRPDGTIDSALALGPDAIRALATHAGGASQPAPRTPSPAVVPLATRSTNGSEPVAAPTAPSPPRLGDPAPAIELPDLDGNPVRLADFRGHPTFVLFWNLGCGICQQMLPYLKTWESDPPQGAPKLLVVSTGTVAENRAMGLTATVVLEDSFATGLAFGARGTPTAVLVDAAGRIASPLAPGARAVLALVTGQEPTEARAGSN
jgi:peroxiredoxin